MTTNVPSFNVTAAFHSQLNTLCIREFPCGYGSWRAPNLSSNVSLKSTGILKSTRSSATVPAIIPENSAQLETVESLQELAVKSPYDVDCTWSSEAESLREIAVKTPDKLTEAFILKFFKSLRIVDKKVTEIDDGLLQLKNLNQLTLSANLIRNIDSKRLPKGLEELELAANQISDISPLCVCPPPLIHLGLSYNLISSITGHMKANSWPHLLSLDLSFNNLADLYNTINVLKTLPKLKNLVLQGNPLALVPGYRGYTIDSIRQLTILDDIRITADEKHFFKGLSKLKDFPVDEAQIMISIKTIKGVKMPEEIEDPEINADYPKTEHKYHVEFQFLKSAPTAVLCESPALSVPTISITADDADSEAQEVVTVYNEDNQPSEDSGLFQTVTTGSLPWNEDCIELDYSKKFYTRLLVPLRDFIKDGIYFTVIKTKHMYVVEDPNVQQNVETKPPASAKSRPGSKMQKVPSKEKSKDSGKGKEKAKDGKGKKNKQEDIELFELPRTRYILGSCQVPLASLLEGELAVETECVCEGGEEAGDNDKKDGGSGAKSDASDKKKQTKDATDKPSKGNLRAAASAKPKGGRGRSSKDDKKAKDKHEESTEDEEDAAPPPPLTIQVQIKLHYWKSAREAAQEFLPQGVPSHTEQS